MTVREMALKCNVDPETVRRWIRDGKIKATGKQYHISEEEADRFIKKKSESKFITKEIARIKRKINDKKKQIIELEEELTRLESLI